MKSNILNVWNNKTILLALWATFLATSLFAKNPYSFDGISLSTKEDSRFAFLKKLEYRLELSGSYVFGFTSDLRIHDEEIQDNFNQGFLLTANNLIGLKNKPLEFGIALGYRQLFYAGSGNDFDYEGRASKANVAFQVNVPLKKLKIMTALEMENNKDFEEFESKVSDLFRYSYSLGLGYRWTDRLTTQITYNRLMSPYSNHYFIQNPPNQLRFGVNFYLL